MVASANAPAESTLANALLKTSILLLWKSAANSCDAAPVKAFASPLYIAPSVAVYLSSALAPDRQACTVPDSVSQMKFAFPPVIGKVDGAPPKTMPVGPPGTLTSVVLTAPVAG